MRRHDESDLPARPAPAGRIRTGASGIISLCSARNRSRTVDVVTTMPGWLVEANGVLHPRGSEYDTQYVVDGMPVYDNRSITFAPVFEGGEFESLSVMAAGIPAEFGRRLGGVIVLDTRRVEGRSRHSEVDFTVGSHSTYLGGFSHQYSGDNTSFTAGLETGHTSRYLDPPSLENFSNKASSFAL